MSIQRKSWHFEQISYVIQCIVKLSDVEHIAHLFSLLYLCLICTDERIALAITLI